MTPKAPVNPMSVAIAGYGKMGESMAKAWVTSPFVDMISILDPFPVTGDLVGHEKITSYTKAREFAKNIAHFDVLVMAVKPQSLDALCGNLHDLPKTVTILSIAAGKNLSYYAQQFGEKHPVVRAMPNTPAAVGKGMTVAVPSPHISDEQKAHVHFLLSCLGKVEWSRLESLMDAVTAVSGSGPAYVFYLVEALTKAGMENGLDKDFAGTLARQTVIGAAALLEDSPDITASELRENVTSPNGTTAAALTALMDGRFQDVLNETVAKAAARSKELSA